MSPQARSARSRVFRTSRAEWSTASVTMVLHGNMSKFWGDNNSTECLRRRNYRFSGSAISSFISIYENPTPSCSNRCANSESCVHNQPRALHPKHVVSLDVFLRRSSPCRLCHRRLYRDYARSIARGMSVLNHTSTSSRGRCSTYALAMRWPSLRISQARRRAAAGKR